MSRRSNAAAGYTLAEFAILVLVFGLVVAGVLKGQELWRNSKRLGTYTHAKAAQSAMHLFIDKYRALPGDMRNATGRLPGCDNAPANSCRNGNGNHMVGIGGQPVYAAQGAGADVENTLFWYHLSAAGFFDEVDIDAPTAPRAWGRTNPRAPGGGGFHIRSATGNTEDAPGDRVLGIYIVWQYAPSGAANTAGNFVLSPHDAAALDRKFDDGAPLTGAVRARGLDTGTAADGCKASATAYAETLAAEGCFMYFRIREASGL